jgi:hypothetical protein
MSKTDPLSAWLDDLREKAELMPSGPYDIDSESDYDDVGRPWRTGWHPGHGGDWLDEEHHAAFFAALDRETVLALVAVVKMAIETNTNGAMHVDLGEDGEMFLHNLSEAMLASAIDDLEALAEERVR